MINIQDEQKALNQAEANSTIDTPSIEETTEEVQEPTVEAESTETADIESESTETVESPKKGANQRIRELANKAREAEKRAESLADQLARVTRGEEMPQKPFIPEVTAGQEITPEQYGQDLSRTANALVDLKIKQYEAVNRINTEAQDVVRTYPELDPESESFNKELSETITEATEAYIRANPYSASVKKFVGKLMKPFKGAVDREVGKATETITKQVSSAAARPNSVRRAEKSAQDMSIQELEEKLGVVQS